MKSFMLKLFCFMLIVSTALFIGTACKNGDGSNEDIVVSQGLEFERSSDKIGYAVAGIGECFDTKIIIPSTYNDKPVVEIKEEAFKDYYLTSITIPNSVTSIGKSAFNGCTSLTSVTIPNSVTSIGSSAFEGCTSLTSITIPNSVTSIGSYAFNGCTSLTSVTIPNSVTSIGYSAFYYCTNLTSITIPNSVTSIGDKAFYNCPIETATIPATAIEAIKNNSLKRVILTSGTSIVEAAFTYCYNLTSITIPNSVTSIGDRAFYNCNLTSITIPNKVTTIGSGAFEYCTNLTSITYDGTKSEWNSISKGSSWNNKVPANYVTCTDGIVFLLN